MQLVFKYKIYPALMLIVCILLALFVVLQNIAIADFLNIMLFKVKQSPMIILSFIFVVLMIRATLNFVINY